MGEGRTYRKIDIYLWNRIAQAYVYSVSTMQAKTCREAKEKYCKFNMVEPIEVKAWFDKRRKYG